MKYRVDVHYEKSGAWVVDAPRDDDFAIAEAAMKAGAPMPCFNEYEWEQALEELMDEGLTREQAIREQEDYGNYWLGDYGISLEGWSYIPMPPNVEPGFYPYKWTIEPRYEHYRR